MPPLYSVGCAYVRMGAWSYLLHGKHRPRFFFCFWVKRLSSGDNGVIKRNILFHLKTQTYE